MIDLLLEADSWDGIGLQDLSERAARATLAHLALSPDAYEIALLACDDSRIATLNADFRGKPRPTNVLSWPSQDLAAETPGARPHPPEPEDEPHHLGDIALAFETCAAEARAADRPFSAHLSHLVVHGVLHLLGYDHIRDADATLMERLEVEILGNLGLPDPYIEDEGPDGL